MQNTVNKLQKYTMIKAYRKAIVIRRGSAPVFNNITN